MATFGLIHGAWHGAWCWERLAPRLEALGHVVRAADLPIEDPDADMTDWVEVVLRSLDGAADPVVLVGHSLGGVLLPLVAARRPVVRQIYLAAIVHPALLPPGAPWPHVTGAFRSLERFPDGSHRWPSLAAAAPVLYDACGPSDAAWAFGHLRRQQTARPWSDVPIPEPRSAGPVSAIVCTGDRVVDPGWGRWAAREVLGAEPLELAADHSPFLSAPDALAALLHGMAVPGDWSDR